MKLLICGDFVPTKLNVEDCVNLNNEKLFGKELLNIFAKHERTIINLECPYTQSNIKNNKSGINLKAPIDAFRILKTFKNPLLCLANNHIYDYGYDGLKSTIDLINKNNYEYIGAGFSKNEIEKIYKEENFAVLNFCEHEFSYDANKNCGANEFNEGIPYLKIQEAKKNSSLVIVIYHGGIELSPFQSKNFVTRCQNMIDFGADFVFCQHSHCVGPIQQYKNGYIFYGQGNFFFRCENDINNKLLQEGIIVSLDTDTKKIDIIHTKINGNGIVFDKSNHLEDERNFYNNNTVDFKKISYEKYLNCELNTSRYIYFLNGIACYSKFRSILEIKFFKGYFLKRKYSNKNSYKLEDYLKCESIRDLFLTNLYENRKK